MMKERIAQVFEESAATLRTTADALSDRVAHAAEIIIASYRAGGRLFAFGNGGSAADAQHIVAEMVGRFLKNRPGLAAEALTTNTSVLTCWANDFEYETIFARQLEANARRGDVAIGLTTSGNSPNVVAALAKARQIGMKTIAFTGVGGGKCAAVADVLLEVPSKATPRVQESHAVMYHIICELVESAMVSNA